jgi:hypothetical protein
LLLFPLDQKEFFMYTARPGLLIGFHGCEKSVRDSIVSASSELKASRNGYDWLGEGFYFWENNYERALQFAQNPPGKKPYKSPSVLGATLDLGYCLDLLDAKYLELAKESYNNIALSTNTTNERKLPSNRSVGGSKDKLLRELDCAVIENLHSMQRQIHLKPFDSVRGVFIEGNELYPDAGFHDKSHIQICIRNPNCIKGFFIPRDEISWKD